MLKSIEEITLYKSISQKLNDLLWNTEFKNGFDPIKDINKPLPFRDKIIDVDKIHSLIKNCSDFVKDDFLNYFIPCTRDKAIPPLIYHYCNVDTFMKIIENKKLFLSNGQIMNDSAELRWIYKIVNEVVSEINFEDTYYIQLFKDRLHFTNTLSYIACFSGCGDLLSQWRGYTNDATGIAIGFDPKYFTFKYQIPSSGGADLTFNKGLYNIEYDIKKQKLVIKNIILDSIYNDYLFINKNIYENCQFSGIDKIVTLSPIFKNPSFEEEDEWRLIYRPLLMDDYENKKKVIYIGDEDKKLKYREKNGTIVSYFEYSFESSFNSKLIPKIILGPKSKIHFKELRYFLTEHELYETEIVPSESTYV